MVQVEKRAVEAGLAHLWSPLVSSTIMCFLRRWALTYLAPPEAIYQEISPAFLTAFGRDTEGAKWTVNFLLEKSLSNITRLSSEPAVLEDTIILITSFADSRVILLLLLLVARLAEPPHFGCSGLFFSRAAPAPT